MVKLWISPRAAKDWIKSGPWELVRLSPKKLNLVHKPTGAKAADQWLN